MRRKPPHHRLQDESDFAVRTQRFVVEDCSSLSYFKVLADPNEPIVVSANVGIYRFVPHPVHGEIRGRDDAIAVEAQHAYVADNTAGARMRALRPRRFPQQLFYS